MPIVTDLSLYQFRNLTSSFSPTGGLNVLIGPNGSGKTSILESIYLLSRNRSFRSHRHQLLINHHHDRAVVEAHGRHEQTPIAIKAVLSRQGKKQIQFNQQPVAKALQLMRLFPVFYVDPHNINLVAAEPRRRRAFMDGLLFHMEQSYAVCYREYGHCLRQRNRLLQHGSSEQIAYWDQPLIERAQRLETQRQALITALFSEADSMLVRFAEAGLQEVEFLYDKGWQDNLADALEHNLSRDRQRGWTHCGCHRADIRILRHGQTAMHGLSLGQQKIVALALLAAAHHLLTMKMEKQIPLMLDDVLSSLDRQTSIKLLDYLATEPAQAFITVTHQQALPTVSHSQMFHVEHNTIKPL